MMTLFDYIDKAKENRGFSSDRQLAKALNISPNTTSQWRNRGVFPTDDTMRIIAIMADEDPDLALLELNIWRSKRPETREAYENILTRLAKTGALAGVVVVGAFLAPGVAEANTGETAGQLMSGAFPYLPIIGTQCGVVVILVFTTNQRVIIILCLYIQQSR